MGYLHINNLYKDQTILMFKECYAMEKIHGTSAHISWDWKEKKINFFSGGEKYSNFVALFSEELLREKFEEHFPNSDVVIFGEAYGGKQQGMSHTYGKQLKFIAFDVKVDEYWLDVPKADDVANKFYIEFVDYRKVSTDLEILDYHRDKPSVQAIRNGVTEAKKREGVVLRPLIELRKNNGERVICKHKGEDFQETKTKREVNPDKMKVLEEANSIADEWVTEMRLTHVLDKLPQDIGIESTSKVISAMIEDVYREAKDEIVESKEVSKVIGSRTAKMFKNRITKIKEV